MSKEQRERTFTQEDMNRVVEERLARDRQERRSDVRVVAEPRTYGLHSPDSYYLDTILMRLDAHGLQHPEAHERLNRYAAELAHEIEHRTAEGQRAERIIREATREGDKRIHERRFRAAMKELRAVTTGGGTTASAASQAAAFVPPLFIMAEYALFRDSYRTFADQCQLLPLPPYGMQAYLPFFSSAAAEAQQTELAGVSETDPATSLQGSPVVTIAGQITITEQLNDRFWSGGSADVVFGRQLQQHYEAKLNTFALNQVIAGGATTVAGSASLTANSWKEVYGDLAKGREQITDSAGVRLRPTHLFTTYDLFSGLTDIMGSDGRPMVLPQEMPGFPPPFALSGADDGLNGGATMPKWARYTGITLPGGLLWFTDDLIPASGSNAQLLVSAPEQSVLVMESPEPHLAVFPQTFAGSLACIVTLYGYASVITRHQSGTSVISGAAYPTTLK